MSRCSSVVAHAVLSPTRGWHVDAARRKRSTLIGNCFALNHRADAACHALRNGATRPGRRQGSGKFVRCRGGEDDRKIRGYVETAYDFKGVPYGRLRGENRWLPAEAAGAVGWRIPGDPGAIRSACTGPLSRPSLPVDRRLAERGRTQGEHLDASLTGSRP
jgi:hypothetical protein